MTDNGTQTKSGESLWRAVFTSGDGWSPAEPFADHISQRSPALAEVNGTLYCAHQGGLGESGSSIAPVRWTSFTPSSVQPFVQALDKATTALPKNASEEDTAQREKNIRAAAEALAAARKWTKDTPTGVSSQYDCVLVNDNGTLRLIHTHTVTGSNPYTVVQEMVLGTKDGAPVWAEPAQKPLKFRDGDEAGAAVLNGTVHVLCNKDGSIVHLTRGADGTWAPLATAGGAAVKTPDAGPSSGRCELAVHDGKLHLLRGAWLEKEKLTAEEESAVEARVVEALRERGSTPESKPDTADQMREHFRQEALEEHRLWHAVFDGAAWSEGVLLPATLQSGDVAGLASYDGKLHAVYAPPGGGTLRHTTWTQKDGWADAEVLEGHESQADPALLVFKDGPAGSEREALLMVHRGVERYVAPVPQPVPAPPGFKDIVSRGYTYEGKIVEDYGPGSWSRVTHQVLLVPAKLKDGSTGVIAIVEAWAQYYWGFGYYPETSTVRDVARLSGGTFRVWKNGLPVKHVDFAGATFDNGPFGDRFRAEVLITGLESGTYEIAIGSSTSTKTGGYWRQTWSDAEQRDRKAGNEYYTQIQLSKSSATITI
ncbi:hypothetical protein ACIRO3_34610 [Streptomyces sp. NPDC102278]|uniref:hypothetical protein n=1 Tax=Streptomyces sp. NPDC102278 TaxID=3366152 RepID=UPI0037FF8AA5